MKKKVLIPVILLLLAAAGFSLWFFVLRDKDGGKNSDKKIYVEKVSTVSGSGIGGETRYMGVVESQATKGVQKDAERTVKERFVSIGDTVKEGDPLFAYDTEDIQLELQQMELEISNMRTGISSDSAALQDMRTQKNQAETEDERLSITASINILVAQINQENYDLEVKLLEYDRKKASLDMNIVYSPMDGVIKAVNETVSGNGNAYDEYGNGNTEENVYITIMEEGDYRVKGTVTEETLMMLSNDAPVIMLSRTDPSQYWRGTITRINMEPATDNNNFYYDGGGEGSSKYYFYITPEDSEGLVMGQHLYVEMDYGQNPGDVVEGQLKLPSYYLLEEDGQFFVWKKNGKDRIEKARISVGDYDEMLDAYVIQDGLTEEDYIAFPEDSIEEGMKTTTNIDEYLESLDQEDFGDGEYYDDGYYGEGEAFGGDIPPVTFDDEGNMYDADGNLITFDEETGRMYNYKGEEITFDDNGNIVPVEEGMQEDGMSEDDMPEDGVISEPATIEE